MNRGRPAGVLTWRRQQVLVCILAARQQGQDISYSRIARLCGLHSYRHARRIVRDLERHGLLIDAEKISTADFLGHVARPEMCVMGQAL